MCGIRREADLFIFIEYSCCDDSENDDDARSVRLSRLRIYLKITWRYQAENIII